MEGNSCGRAKSQENINQRAGGGSDVGLRECGVERRPVLVLELFQQITRRWDDAEPQIPSLRNAPIDGRE